MAHESYELIGDVSFALGVQHVEVRDYVAVDDVALYELAICIAPWNAEPLRYVLNAEHREEKLVRIGDGLVWVIVVHAISVPRPATYCHCTRLGERRTDGVWNSVRQTAPYAHAADSLLEAIGLVMD